MDVDAVERAFARPIRIPASGRARRLVGRRARTAIRLSKGQALPAPGARRHFTWFIDGPRQTHRTAQDGDATALQGPRLPEADRGRHLWRRIAVFAEAGAPPSSSCELVERLRLLSPVHRRPWLE